MDVARSGVTQYMFLVPRLMKLVILITLSNKTKKDHNGNNKSNSSLQQPAPPFNETDINTICFSQELAPEITTETTSLNTTTETSPIVPTNIQIPIATNNLNDPSNFTQKTILKIEAQLLVIKSYVDCELSMFTSKIDAELPPKKTATFREPEKNYSWSR